MEKPFPAYKGDEPYIFVSYAHADDALVYPEIRSLHDRRVIPLKLVGQARGQYTFFAHLKWMPVIALGYATSIWVHLIVNSRYDGVLP